MSARKRRAKSRRRKQHGGATCRTGAARRVLAPAALTGALATSFAIGASGPEVGSAKAASGKAETVTPQFFASEIQNIFDGPQGSSPGSFAEVNGTLFFTADDGSTGRELWKTDGTPGGATLVQDIDPGAPSSNPSNLTDVNGTMFFTANDGLTGYQLWKSDGTAAGTVEVKGFGIGYGYPQDLTNVNGTLFFTAFAPLTGRELWESDGTGAGTVLVKDIQDGPPSTNPGDLTNVNGTLFFTANDGSTGKQLWKSDGTAAGTVEVKDIGVDGSYPGDLTNVNGTLFFSATDDGYRGYGLPETTGRELWRSDGTAAGTVMVKDINDPPYTGYRCDGSHYPQGSYPSDLTNVNGTLFFAADDCVKGSELWKSDGTEGGTVLVKDINTNVIPNYYSNYTLASSPSNLTNVNGTVFFSADDGSDGNELWKSDGTSAGTVLVKDVQSGAPSATPGNLTNVNGTLFFTADDGSMGAELWASDGTTDGTVLVKDINPGSGDSGASQLTSFNGNLLFAANDGVTGSELWEAGAGDPPLDPTSTGVNCAPASVPIGSATDCTATVHSASNATVPFGSVVFFATGPSSGFVGNCGLDATGVATSSCHVTFTPSLVGDYTISGSYFADAGHGGSSGEGSLTVTPVDTTSTGVTCSPSSVTVGSPTSCTVTVVDTASSGALTPSGKVSFTAGPSTGSFGSPNCTLAATGATTASCHVTFAPSAAGGYTITGSYGGDSGHHPSSGEGSLTAKPSVDTTSTGVSCSPSLVTVGSSTSCTVTVMDNASIGSLTPTGNVSFAAGPSTGSFGSPNCTLAAAGATTASCHVTFTPSAAGGYTITGSYGGDSRHHLSSGTGSLTAKPAGGLGKASVGKITISGTTAKVRITCTGETGKRCPVTLRMSTKTKKKVVVGKSAKTIAAGHKVAVRISLNADGKRLLAKLHKMRVSLVVREKTTKIATRKLSFKSAKNH